MSNFLIQQLPKLENALKENSVRLEIEQGVVVFRASKEMQNRIENLLEKNKVKSLTDKEEIELNTYEEIDDYLSRVNRLIRNSSKESEVNIAA
jgi:predicted DNA-binding protein